MYRISSNGAEMNINDRFVQQVQLTLTVSILKFYWTDAYINFTIIK